MAPDGRLLHFPLPLGRVDIVAYFVSKYLKERMVHCFDPNPDGTHVQHPPREEVTFPVLDPNYLEPVALLDLGRLFPELKGHQCLCLGMSVGAVDEYLVMEQAEDGRWRMVSVDGATPKQPTKGSEWAEPFGDGAYTFMDLPHLAAADLIQADALDMTDEQRCLSLQLGEPKWIQSSAPPQGEGWVFVARLDSWLTTGSVYVFYQPSTRQAHHLIQFS